MNERLMRLGGAALIAGSVVLAGVDLVLRLTGGADGDDPTNPVNIAGHAMGMLAGLLVIVGLPAFIGTLARRAPVLSVIGFVLLTAAILVYEVAIGLLDVVVLPYLAANHINPSHPPAAMFPFFMGGGFAEMIGNLILGIAIFRTGAFSRVAGFLLIGAGVLMAATLGPVPEWVDTIWELGMAAALAIAGAQLTGIVAGQAPIAARTGPAATTSA